MTRSVRHSVALAAIAVFALTACSGDDEPTTVAVSNISGTGEALVTTEGRALYTTEQDAGGKPACVTESCVAMWVPLTVPADQDPTGPESVSGRLGTVARPDGARQVTLDSKPLYTFTLDKDTGKATTCPTPSTAPRSTGRSPPPAGPRPPASPRTQAVTDTRLRPKNRGR